MNISAFLLSFLFVLSSARRSLVEPEELPVRLKIIGGKSSGKGGKVLVEEDITSEDENGYVPGSLVDPEELPVRLKIMGGESTGKGGKVRVEEDSTSEDENDYDGKASKGGKGGGTGKGVVLLRDGWAEGEGKSGKKSGKKASSDMPSDSPSLLPTVIVGEKKSGKKKGKKAGKGSEP